MAAHPPPTTRAPQGGPVCLIGRFAAIAAGLCAITHLPLITAGILNPAIGALMLVMSAGCLWCAIHLWQSPAAPGAALMAVMSGAMLALHHIAGLGLSDAVAGHGHGGEQWDRYLPTIAALAAMAFASTILVVGAVRRCRFPASDEA